MARVTSFTADRMLLVENSSIVNGVINSEGHLILQTYGGDSIDAGKVVGAPGTTHWEDLLDKPTTFPPSAHTHPWGEVTGKPSTFPPSAHTHPTSQITDFATATDARINSLVPVATTSVQGKSALATNVQTQTGTDSTRAVTPASLSSRTATETRTGLMKISDMWEIYNGKETDDKNALTAITPKLLQIGLEDHIGARHGFGVSFDRNDVPNSLDSKNMSGFYFASGGDKTVGDVPSDAVSNSNLFVTIQNAVGEALDNSGWGLGTFQLLYEISPSTFSVVRSWYRFWNGTTGELSEGTWKRTDATWSVIEGKPTTFPPSAHTHPWGEVTGKPTTFPPSGHAHPTSQITDFASATDARINSLVPPATTSTAGKVPLATVAETNAGTNSTKAVTPAGLKNVLDNLPPGDTQHPGSGDQSIQLGDEAEAFGNFSIAIGVQAIANGAAGVSLGSGSQSFSYGSAFGTSSTSGEAGTAFGSSSKATGVGSAAFGGGAEATHASASAFGVFAKTTKDHQIMLGTEAEEVYFPGYTAHRGDTNGWVNITVFEPGFTTGGTPGQLQYLIKNQICYWRGGVNGNFNSGTYYTFRQNIPAEARPMTGGANPLRGGAGFSGANSGLFEIHNDGHMVMGHASGAVRVWGAFTTAYPVIR